MMRFKLTILSFISLLHFLPAAASTSDAANITAVKGMDIAPYNEALKGFKDTVTAEIYEYLRFEDSEKNNAFLFMLKNQNTDLIFTIGTSALNLVKDEFKDIPIVYTFVLNPDIIAGNRRANITGIDINITPDEQFKAMLEVMPSARRVGVVYDPSKNEAVVREAETAARNLGLTFIARKVRKDSDAINAVSQLEGKVDILWMIPDTTAITPESIEYIFLFSFKNGIPLFGISDKYVKNGALFALTIDNEDIGRQAGEIASRVLMGEDVKTIPVRRPRKFKLSINLITAEKMGVKVPGKVIGKAGKVYR